AFLVGRADPAAPRVRRQGQPRPHHQARLEEPALGADLIEAIQHVPAGHPLRQRRDAIIARRGKEAKNIAKVAMARQLLTWVYYAMRDGQARSLAAALRQAA